MRFLFSLIMAALLAGCAKEDEAVCRNINKAIDEKIVSAALLISEQSYDRSAIQQNARDARLTNELGVIQVNLTLLSQNNCSPRVLPIVPDDYVGSARKCIIARAKVIEYSASADPEAKLLPAKADAACKFSSWSRG